MINLNRNTKEARRRDAILPVLLWGFFKDLRGDGTFEFDVRREKNWGGDLLYARGRFERAVEKGGVEETKERVRVPSIGSIIVSWLLTTRGDKRR